MPHDENVIYVSMKSIIQFINISVSRGRNMNSVDYPDIGKPIGVALYIFIYLLVGFVFKDEVIIINYKIKSSLQCSFHIPINILYAFNAVIYICKDLLSINRRL